MAVRTIGSEIKLSGEKEFNDGMKAINSNLKTLRSDMAAVSATFEDNAGSVEALTAKNKILQDSVEQQRVKVDALRQMYEKVSAASGENSAAADKWKQQLNNATVALAKEEKALRQNNEALEKAKSAADSAEKAAEDLAEANSDVARTADRAADELDDMTDKAEKTSSILPAVAQGFGTIASGAAQASAAVLAVSAGLGTAAITAMVSFAKESAEAAKAAAEAKEPLTETQQAWLAYADKLSTLDNAAAQAKQAIGGMILPQLNVLSLQGASYLNRFARSMEAAAGDTEHQARVLTDYIVRGVDLILDNLPEYIEVGETLLSGLKDGFMKAAPDIWATAKPLIQEWLTGLGSHGPEVIESAIGIIGQLISGLGENADAIIPIAGALIGAIVNGLTDSLPEIGAAAGEILYELISYLLDNLDEIGLAGLKLGIAFMEAVAEGIAGAFIAVQEKLGGLFSALSTSMQFQTTGTFAPLPIPGHADGLSRVPYDNYLARLHKDEMVLTAAEAALYRSGRGGGTSYNSLSMPIYVQTLTPEQLEQIWAYVNERFGESM